MVNKDNKNNTNELFFDFTLIEDEDLWRETNLAFKDSKDDIPTLNNRVTKEEESKSDYNKMTEDLTNMIYEDGLRSSFNKKSKDLYDKSNEDKSIYSNKDKDMTRVLYSNNSEKNNINSDENNISLSQSVRDLKKSDSPYVRAYYEELKTINKLKRSRRTNNVFDDATSNIQVDNTSSSNTEPYDEKMNLKKDIFGKNDNVINKIKSNVSNDNIFKNLKNKHNKVPSKDIDDNLSSNNIQPLEKIKKEFNNTIEHDLDLTNLLSKINSINVNKENNKNKEADFHTLNKGLDINKNITSTKMSRKLRRKMKEKDIIDQNKKDDKDQTTSKNNNTDYENSYSNDKDKLLENNFDTNIIDLERIEQSFHTEDLLDTCELPKDYKYENSLSSDIKPNSTRIIKRRDRKTNKSNKSDNNSLPHKRSMKSGDITNTNISNNNAVKNNDNKVLQTILILIIIFIIAITSLIISFKFISSNNQLRYSKPSITNKI